MKRTTITWGIAVRKPPSVEFDDRDTVQGLRLPALAAAAEGPKRALAQAFVATVHYATQAAATARSSVYVTRGGIPNCKTRGMQARDDVALETYVGVLDHAFHWRGEWGSTPAAIRSELERRAKLGGRS